MKKISFKNHRIVKAGVILVLVAFISSCDWIDPELNVDPDSPGDVPMSLILPAIQQTMGFSLLGNNSVRTTNIWVQLYDGVTRQSFTEARYQLTAADVNNFWGNVYTEILLEAKILAEKAVEEGSPHNEGVAKLISAYTLGIMTDLFGDIPYSEALRGTENILEPNPDSQQDVYASIFTLLDEAIAALETADDPIGISGDAIYGGDPDAWLAAAHAVYARAELQLSKKNGASAYNNALSHIGSAIASNGGDLQVPFEAANKNPMFQFMEQRTDVRMCQTFLDELNANADPRAPFYFAADGNGELSGSAPGSANEAASYPGSYIADEAAPVVLMSYAEVKFIEAEAALQTGDAQRAADAFNAAVLASVAKVTGEDGQTWMDDNNITANTGNISLEDIIMQKRHALVGQIQPFSDWRRTGIPSLSMAAGATKTEIPRRFPYSQDETIYNSNLNWTGTIIDRVWWDQ